VISKVTHPIRWLTSAITEVKQATAPRHQKGTVIWKPVGKESFRQEQQVQINILRWEGAAEHDRRVQAACVTRHGKQEGEWYKCWREDQGTEWIISAVQVMDRDIAHDLPNFCLPLFILLIFWVSPSSLCWSWTLRKSWLHLLLPEWIMVYFGQSAYFNLVVKSSFPGVTLSPKIANEGKP
jgi:hypothetical protein